MPVSSDSVMGHGPPYPFGPSVVCFVLCGLYGLALAPGLVIAQPQPETAKAAKGHIVSPSMEFLAPMWLPFCEPHSLREIARLIPIGY